MLTRVLLREHERERQAWEAERRRLIETICHLAEKPLDLAPYVLPALEESFDGSEHVDPAQLPDY